MFPLSMKIDIPGTISSAGFITRDTSPSVTALAHA
jgi:hypothetical protein